jgi:hypothetical protein
MRDYVMILHQAFAGDATDQAGRERPAPYRGGSSGSPPIAIGLEPNPDIPTLIGPSEPEVTRLAIGDGWMPSSLAAGMLPAILPLLQQAFARRATNEHRRLPDPGSRRQAGPQ